MALASDGRIDEALEAMRTAIEERDDLAHAYRDLGRLLSDLEQWEGAIEAFSIARGRSTSDPEVAIGLAFALAASERTDKALKVLLDTVEHVPASVEVRSALGNLYRRSHDHAAALKLTSPRSNTIPTTSTA